jgi:predicted enzyme related to lactoylglutathione lyase
MSSMPLASFKDLCIDVSDARRSGDYWSTLLGWRLEMHDDGDAHLRDDSGRIQVWLNVVPEPKTVKNRIHLDVNAESLRRALDAGATVLEELPRWTVLADPDGQEHCVFVRTGPIESRAYELVWDCAEGPEASHELATWWRAVVGGHVVDDERGFSWVQDIPECPWSSFDFTGVPEPKTVKNRIHIDVATDDLTALVDHGATVLRPKGDGGIGWAVMADPAGNEFCAFGDD